MPKADRVDAGLFVSFAFPSKGDPLLALSPRGTRLAVAWEGADAVQVIDTRAGRAVTRCSGFAPIGGIGFVSANVLLVTTREGCFRCDLGRGDRAPLLAEPGLSSITVGPNGRIVALGAGRELVLYDIRKGQVLHRLQTDLADAASDYIWDCRAAFSAGGRYVAGALVEAYYHGNLVVIWEVRTGRRQRVFDTLARALAFCDDTLSLALADDWGYLNVYEPDQGEEPAVRFSYKEAVYWMRFQPGGRALEILLDQGSVIRVAARTGRAQGQTEPPARDGLSGAVASADWSAFAAVAQDGVAIWPRRQRRPRNFPAR